MDPDEEVNPFVGPGAEHLRHRPLLAAPICHVILVVSFDLDL